MRNDEFDVTPYSDDSYDDSNAANADYDDYDESDYEDDEDDAAYAAELVDDIGKPGKNLGSADSVLGGELSRGVVSILQLAVRALRSALDIGNTGEPLPVTPQQLFKFVTAIDFIKCNEKAILAAGVSQEAVIMADRAFADPFAFHRLVQPFWLILVRPPHEPLPARPLFVDMTVTLGFMDDRVLQLRAQTPWPATERTTSGIVGALLQEQGTQLGTLLAREGAAALLEKSGQKIEGLVHDYCKARHLDENRLRNPPAD